MLRRLYHEQPARFACMHAGSNRPYKVKLQAPTYPHLAAMDHMCRRHMLADVSAALGSIDVVFGEVNR